MSQGTDFYVGPSGEPDKYRLVHQVGSGGEAQLWKAELNVSGTWEPVAVKSLRPDRAANQDAWQARWAEQAEVLRFIRHPGVVGVREHFEGGQMHYAGEEPAGPTVLYLVMNWIDGVPLRDWVPLHRGAEEHFEAMRYLAQIGDVLDWLHSGQATPSGRPVIHADVTPANVHVTPGGQAVLVDFGLTRLAAGKSPAVEGTRGYMAPEVLASAAYSAASDRYSFGALTYFVLTGQNPAADSEAIRQGLLTVGIVASQPGLIDHLMQMFAPDPSARPPAAGDWIRLFRMSGSTTFDTPSGLRPTAPFAGAGTTPLADGPKRNRKRVVVGLAIAAAVALMAAVIALAANRGSSTKHNLSNAAATSTPAASDVITGTLATTSSVASTTTTTVPSATTSTNVDSQGNPILPTFLADTSTVGGSSTPSQGVETINGTSYPHSIGDDLGCNAGNTATHEYDLGRHFATFQAVEGLEDTSPSGARVQFDVYLDGNHASTNALVLGQSVPLKLSVTGALRLKLTTTLLAYTDPNRCGSTIAGWGDGEILP